MFSNTAYEALYQYLGLELHARFIEIITSQKVFIAVILMIFGTMFFLTSVQFFSRYMPGALVNRRHVPLSKYFKIVAFLFLGLALLRVGSQTSVKRYTGQSWHENAYVHGQMKTVAPEYRVSVIFDLMSRSAEEVTALISKVVDGLFRSSNSQIEAPNFFFKAMMYAGASTIEDPNLKEGIKFYTDECFDRVVPYIRGLEEKNQLDPFFGIGGVGSRGIDRKLSELRIPTPDNSPYNCLDVKNELQGKLKDYAIQKDGGIGRSLDVYLKGNTVNQTNFANLQVSNYLINEFNKQRESGLGVQKGSELPGGTTSKIFQHLGRLFSFDGILSAVSGGELQGATLAAKRSQEFSENLARAPHIAGFIKMFLIAIFPWLLFAVVAGYWRVLWIWFLIYFSVLLWTPIWMLLYHVVTSLSQSAEILQAFGKLNDGVSLYSAALIDSRMYHLFEVYSWLQVLTGTLFTGSLLWFLRPALSDTEKSSAPEFIDDGASAAKTGASVAGKFI